MRQRRGWLAAATLLSGTAGAQQGATYTGPQAVVYIGDRWCSGGYCGGGTSGAFEDALNQALDGSGYVRAVRQEGGATLRMSAGITSVSGGGSLCLPIVGCLNSTNVRAGLELVDVTSGAVVWRDTCEGTSAGLSTWSHWYGSVSFSSDDAKAAADCAGKLVQKLTRSSALTPYLKLPRGTPLNTTASTTTPGAGTPTPAGEGVSAAAAVATVNNFLAALASVSPDDANALLTAELVNPVRAKAVRGAMTQATVGAAAQLKLSATASDVTPAYTLVSVAYTTPGAAERSVTLAVTNAAALNTRGGARVLYFSPLNPNRSAPGAALPVDALSRNVETLVTDLWGALGLPAAF